MDTFIFADDETDTVEPLAQSRGNNVFGFEGLPSSVPNEDVSASSEGLGYASCAGAIIIASKADPDIGAPRAVGTSRENDWRLDDLAGSGDFGGMEFFIPDPGDEVIVGMLSGSIEPSVDGSEPLSGRDETIFGFEDLPGNTADEDIALLTLDLG